jgi:predicted transcriptional regulator
MGLRLPSLSKAELEIARIVWDLHGATVREVFEALPPERNIDFKTVQTYLRRMEAKGYLRTRFKGKGKFYTPRVPPRRVIADTIDDLLKRLFDGEALPLFQQIISERGLTDEEIEKLRIMLDKSEAEHDDS